MFRFLPRLFPVCLGLALLATFSGTVTSVAAPHAAAPQAQAALQPVPFYGDGSLRGSAAYSDPEGDLEGASQYRWLVNGAFLTGGDIPQTLLLPLDGSLLSSDGEAPLESQGLAFAAGRFGQAVTFSPAAGSALAYATANNLTAGEGSLDLWVKLAYDLDDPAYDSYPRLFSYVATENSQLYVEVNQDRVILTSYDGSGYHGTWPPPPGWQAGEWHHLAATWSASADRMAVYYDCVLAGEGEYPGLPGSAGRFNLGSGDGWGVISASLDDVRLSRRALSAAQVAAACQRGGAAPHDEVVLPPGQVTVGDQVSFEVTPCDSQGMCGQPSTAVTTVVAPPLSTLLPEPQVLASGTSAITLSLTTTAPADCRWSEQPGQAYAAMAHAFEGGQGTTAHSTTVGGWADLANRHFYVRCADRTGSRSPDDYERSTHLRQIGPWDGDYPRLANIWGGYDPAYGPEFFAGYDLYVSGGWGGAAVQADAIRAINPRAKVLLSANATYGYLDGDPLTVEWGNSQPGDPGYNCLLRDTNGAIIVIDYWGHPMYNLTVPYCRNVLAQQSLDAYLSAQPDQGADLAYDGLYWDRLHDTISWFSPDIDSDLDGLADDPAVLDAAYQAGMMDFFAQMRDRLPNAVLMGNDGPQIYAPWLNGRLYEWQLASILDGSPWVDWNSTVSSYRDWSRRGHRPYTTFIESSPEPLFSEKYGFQNLDRMPPAMEAEAAASYARMRFGLTSALMGDGLFSYDYGPDWHGNLWWYDEFGAAGAPAGAAHHPTAPDGAVLPHGYLGQPAGEPYLLVDHLDTPNPLLNPGFEDGLNHWDWWVDTAAGSAAAFDAVAGAGVAGSRAAHINVLQAAPDGTVEFRQSGIHTVAGEYYTLSFWARSSVTMTLTAAVIKSSSPWTDYGFWVTAQLTPEWQHFQLPGGASVSATDGKLMFLLGDTAGEVWLDEVQFQVGELGVWARSFEHGLALVNATHAVQTALLPAGGRYYRLKGEQAPLFQTRMDDDAGAPSAGWQAAAANWDQIGAGVHTAPAGSGATFTYRPTLAYGGAYEVLAWVAPDPAYSPAAGVTIQHSGGATGVSLDQQSGEPGWRSLGVYTFPAGQTGSLTLTAAGQGQVVADAFKWVSVARYNDGSQVDQVTLQPLDGIVLIDQDPNAVRVQSFAARPVARWPGLAVGLLVLLVGAAWLAVKLWRNYAVVMP